MKHIKKNYNFTSFEPLIIIAFWALLFASPLLFGRFENQIDWSHILKVWISYLPLLGLFLINRFLLMPLLFFKGKKLWFFISVTAFIAISALAVYSFENKGLSQRNSPLMEREGDRGFQNPPPRFSGSKPPLNPQMKEQLAIPKPIPEYANFLILAVLLVGFDAGLQMSVRWANMEQEKFKLQKENVENQLAFLKNQVSPHFFMNTLNNIHALVDIDTEEAKSAIIKLSNLMRHLLYDSEGRNTPIKKEIEFITSYIELMRLRFSDKVRIKVEIPSIIPEKSIPPLLFTSLLENAFKHGISYKSDSFINIALSFSEDSMNFKIENSNQRQDRNEEASGIGIENTMKRLDLLYNKNYSFAISDTERIYRVNLTIPI